VRGRTAAAALVEQQHVVALRVEQLPMHGRASAAGAAMQEHGWFALRIAAEFPIDLVSVAGVQHAVAIRLDSGIQHDRQAVLWKIRSQTPCPRRRPRVSNLVWGRYSG